VRCCGLSIRKCSNALKASLSVNTFHILCSQPTIAFGIQQHTGVCCRPLSYSSVGRKLKDLHIFQAKDSKPFEIIRAIKQGNASYGRYLVRREILYAKNESFPYWRPILSAELEDQVISHVHGSLGHLGTEKCMHQISHTLHVKNLGRKARRLISRCDMCQMVKHPNRRFETESRIHMPKAAGDHCLSGAGASIIFSFAWLCLRSL